MYMYNNITVSVSVPACVYIFKYILSILYCFLNISGIVMLFMCLCERLHNNIIKGYNNTNNSYIQILATNHTHA